MTQVIQISTVTATREEADHIATTLVERHLAACVQVVGPITSIYRWEGRLETAHEWLCLIKTVRANYTAVETAVRELHSYQVPEILAADVVAGSASYLQWVGEQVQDR